MKKIIISEQSTQRVVDATGVTHDALLELAKQYCAGLENFKFKREHPTKGADALSYQRTDGGFNFIINNNNMVTKERYDTSRKLLSSEVMSACQNKISSYIPLPWTKDQENSIIGYTTNHKGVIKDKPDAKTIRNYTPIDMFTIDPKLFPTPKLIYVYSHSSLNGLELDQVAAINALITSVGWTIDIPLIGTKELAQGADAIQKMKELGVETTESKKVLVDANAKRANSTIESERGPLKLYPIATTGSSEVDMVTNLEALDTAIKDKIMSKNACRKSIKFLSKKSEANKGNGYRTSDVDPKMLANARQFAQSCVTQGTKYLGGIFGINDEIKDLQACRNPWCLGQPCEPGQSYDGERKRCMGTRTNENTISLKNLIRESLIETKKTKEKNVLSEGKIVKARLSIISENVNFKTKKQKDKFFDELLSEMVYLNSQGFDKQVINEGFFDMLKSLLGHTPDGVMEYFKEYMGKWLVEHLTPMDSEGWFGSMIITGIGNLPIGDIPKLTDCNYLTKWISKTAAEGTVRKLTHEKGLDGAFYDVLRNSIVDMLDSTSLGSKIEEGLGSIICPLLGGVKNKMEKATDTLKQKALATS